MYLSHFRLERAPFRNTPDPLFFFAGEGNREAMAGLLEGVLDGQGTILLAGDIGTGKSTLAQALKASLIDSHIVIEISNPWSSHEEILEAIRHNVLITETAATDTPTSEAAIMAELKDRLIELDHIGRRVVLLIDEAHQLPSRSLEGLAQIARIATPERQLIQIVLFDQIGQGATGKLAEKLAAPALHTLRHRSDLTLQLRNLDQADSDAYIRHRLHVAGGSDALFPPESMAIIHATAHGNPQIINRLCDFCLLTAYHRNARCVSAAIAGEMVASLLPASASAMPPASAPLAPETETRPAVQPAVHPSARPDPAPQPAPPASPGSPVAQFMAPEIDERGVREEKPPGGLWQQLFIALLLGLAVGAAALAGASFLLEESGGDIHDSDNQPSRR